MPYLPQFRVQKNCGRSSGKITGAALVATNAAFRGGVLMDNPLNAAIWLAQALRRDGVALKPGDQLSLGGFLGSMPTQPGTSITVRYLGLPGDPAVTVHFDRAVQTAPALAAKSALAGRPL